MNFFDLSYLQQGSEKQKKAFQCLTELHLPNQLARFNACLCGTIPLDLIIDSSDLDIIAEVNDFNAFRRALNKFRHLKGFKLKEKQINGKKVLKVNFFHKAFEVEVFGQPVPVIKQNAYLHMVIENHLLEKNGRYFREQVMQLKQLGYKTEPAFCRALHLPAENPYLALIEYAKEQQII
ncbi:protein of unknown function [Amphibacillus marinus]|uniref:DUF4269 domain-containing protein n=1 Tax=Amphibacillus marinus TaxID=872970 RepID=A0A1H8KJW6_9BACI|nr:DUF4269 domain-containing protein [Amphibacillus marinus]SEN93212.1 protein of unknown function [Amphibacillus marinus]